MIAAAALVLALAAAQQTPELEGRVTAAATGEPVSGAIVRVTELARWTTTADDGSFALRDMTPGRWSLRVERAGMMPATVSVLVPETGTLRVDIELRAAPATPHILGRVVDATSGDPVVGASVAIEGGAATETERDGGFRIDVARDGTYPLRAWAYGYQPVDTAALASWSPAPLELRLPIRPIGMRPLSVRASSVRGPQAERELFDREPRPGVIGMSMAEIDEVPVMLEPDVIRSIQALPGVVQVNDLSARLHVRGGGPDQNLFLLDGARVFAPYHMFGIYGAFNPAAVSRVDFYRGDLAARHGGALSSVVDVSQRDDASRWVEGDVTAGILAVGGSARGIVPGVQGRWMVAGRRSTVADVLESELLWGQREPFPFRFSDIQARLSLQPTPSHRVSGSWFDSADRFRMFLDESPGTLRSGWTNRVRSLRWDADLSTEWSTGVSVWRSGYDMWLATRQAERVPTSTNQVDITGYRAEATRRGVTGWRVGVDIQHGGVHLAGGDRPGGYIEGERRADYRSLAAYIETDRRFGPLRLAPGLRVEELGGNDRWLVAPRLAARLDLSERVALTVGASRTHQDLSTLRDDRFVLPGPPFWFAHGADEPVSAADGLSLALEGWLGPAWSFSLNGYARRFADLPTWRPVGDRTAEGVEWHDGSTHGVELILRRHAERLHGWVSYGYSETGLTENGGRDYQPVWDRRHAVDASVFVRLGRLRVGTRAIYGTGTPFWPPSGSIPARWLGPTTGRIESRGTFPYWSDAQLRFPTYFRVDAFSRLDVRIGPVRVTPYAGLLNLTGRPNVLYYDIVPVDVGAAGSQEIELRPNSHVRLTLVPSFGFDIHF